ncbi:MAG TPA: hypothetical protein PLU30_08895, partial [Verrucomicrobiae bacterium]|nr:hypothetical protein [Verrucomicrobiae bacterium]
MKNGSKVADACRRPNGYFLTAVATALALLTGVGTNTPPRIERVELSEGTNLHIDASGRPGKIFRLERSTTLTNWSDVDSVDATTTNFSFLRSIAAGPGEFFRVSMHPGTNAPAWADQEDMRISVLTTNAVRLRWGGATGLLEVTAYRVYRDGILIAELPTGARSYDAGALGQGTAYTFRVEAVNEDGVVSRRSLSGTINPSPPDPASIAPGPGSSEVSTPQNGFGFLYAGQNPIQTGVSTQDIDSVRCAIVHGKVMDQYFNPLQGTVISVDDHPEFGRTVTRADGEFDMAVNGGGALTLLFAREDRLPARRTVNPAWGDDVVLQSVVLIEPDPIPTELVFPSNGMQMAEGSLMEDQDGSRRMRLLVPAGTTAQMVMPNGTRQTLEFGHLRLSEYTVGTNGPLAMPAPLPGSSEYTYAVNLSFDEEREAGAQRVEFSPDVVGYVENLAGFPVGIPVPIGTLLDDGVWVPQKDGRVVEVVGETAGLADIDIDGDGAADDEGELAAIGISESERRKVAELYTSGTELWRMPYPFISNKDANWAPGTNGKKTPSKAKNSQKTNKPSCDTGYGVLEMQNQILQEDVAVVGAPFTLHYASDRMPGYLADHILDIDIIGASVPPELVKVDMTIKVVGRSFESTLAPQANVTNVFLWDGLDAYGREVQGRVPIVCQLDYVYPGYYCHPSPNAQNGFATMSGMFITNPATGQPIRMREDIRLTTVHESELGRWNALGHALGGWSLSIHHVYDPVKRVVYLGDGGRQDINGPSGQIVMSSGGTGTNGFGGDGGDAAFAEMNAPRGAVVGPDGSIYVADTQNNRIRKISGPSNIIETVVGTGTAGFSGDDGPGTSAQVNGPRGLAMDPQGNLYFCDTGNNRVRCLGVDGVVTTVAGTGAAGFGGDGGFSTAAQLNGPQGVAVATDGALFVADTENNRVRRIGLDGIIDTAAGTGTAGFSGDDGSGLVAQLNKPSGVALAEDGSLFIADTGNNRVRELRRDGRISTYAGTGAAGGQGDGGDPSQAQLNAPAAVGVGRDSTVYIADASNSRVRRVGSNRIITTAGGTGTPGYDGEGAPGPQAQFDGPQGVAVGPDRRAYVADSNNGAVRGMGRPMTPGGPQEVKIGSEDGTQVYVFDASGRHLRTMNA